AASPKFSSRPSRAIIVSSCSTVIVPGADSSSDRRFWERPMRAASTVWVSFSDLRRLASVEPICAEFETTCMAETGLGKSGSLSVIPISGPLLYMRRRAPRGSAPRDVKAQSRHRRFDELDQEVRLARLRLPQYLLAR